MPLLFTSLYPSIGKSLLAGQIGKEPRFVQEQTGYLKNERMKTDRKMSIDI
jgi:hypothetical protein